MSADNEHLGPHQVPSEDWIACAPFEQLLGMKIVEAEEGQSTLTMPFTYQLANGGNLMHGGALVSLADTAAVMAIKSLLAPGTHFATISMAIDFQQPVTQGLVMARGRVRPGTDRLWQAEIIISDQRQHTVMQCHAVFKTARQRQPAKEG